MRTPGTDHDHGVRPPWSRSDRFVPRTVVRPLQEFLQTSTSGGALLLAAVVVALVWANSPWQNAYARLLGTPLTFRVGDVISIDEDLHFWVNDGLMTLFFMLVGLEIKREMTSGELRRARAAALPVLAAVGGMVVPAMLYLAVAGSGGTARGWGIPMATDIAFALGLLALASAYASPNLKPLLLTLAIVDDIGAILVIALFYTGGIAWTPLLAALGVIGAIVALRLIHVRAPAMYAGLGAALWYATYRTGIHPTIAGVIVGLLTPAEPFQRPRAVSEEAHRTADETTDHPLRPDEDAHWWLRLAWLSREAVSPLARVEHALLPWSSFVILPVFALANAGVELSRTAVADAMTNAAAIGIVVGLVVGKPLGVALLSTLAVRGRLGVLPQDVGWGDLAGMGMTAGIGFTVALFIAELAFAGTEHLDEAKIGILVASLVAGTAAYLILRLSPSPTPAGDPPAESA